MQFPTPAPAPEAPAAPGQAAPASPPGVSGASASAVYEALRAQRRELASQLERAEDVRRDLSNRFQEPEVTGVDRKGIEQRIVETDQRITVLNQQIAESDARIALQAGVPGAVQPPRPVPGRDGPPEEVFVLAGMFIVVVLLPLSIAMARRIWKKGMNTVMTLPAELMDRLTRLEQGMDAVAVEVERIGEGQRYMARMMTEDGSLRAIGAGAAEPVEVKAREAEAQYRR